jgi:hypothetical protein
MSRALLLVWERTGAAISKPREAGSGTPNKFVGMMVFDATSDDLNASLPSEEVVVKQV